MKKQKMYFVTKLFFLSIILFAFVFMNSCQKDSGLTDIEAQAEQLDNPGVYSNVKKISDLDDSQLKSANNYPIIYINTPVNNRVYEFDNLPVSFNQIGYNININNAKAPAYVTVYLDNSVINSFSNLPSGNLQIVNDYTTSNVSLGAGQHSFSVRAVNSFIYPGPGYESQKSVVFTVKKRDTFNVSISGPSYIIYPFKGEPLVTGTWCANVSTSGTYTYKWYRKINSGSYYLLSNTSSCYSRTYGFQGYGQSSTVYYKVEVTNSAGLVRIAYKTVYESSSDGAIVP